MFVRVRVCACACVCVVAGALVLQISCFSEAERVYMLAKDTSVCNKQLTSLVIPQILVTQVSLPCRR